MLNNPDNQAAMATFWAKEGMLEHAFHRAKLSIQARAQWVLVNGQWKPRQNIMRKDK